MCAEGSRILCEFGEVPAPAFNKAGQPRNLDRSSNGSSILVLQITGAYKGTYTADSTGTKGASGPVVPLGKMISCLNIVPWARYHARPLQRFLMPFQREGTSSSKVRVWVPPQVLLSLGWWTSEAIQRGCYFREPCRVIVTLDASLLGWGGPCGSQVGQGHWSQQEYSQQINWLELRGALLTLQAFLPQVRGKHVFLLTDNMTTKTHLNKAGGTLSRSLMLEGGPFANGRTLTFCP